MIEARIAFCLWTLGAGITTGLAQEPIAGEGPVDVDVLPGLDTDYKPGHSLTFSRGIPISPIANGQPFQLYLSAPDTGSQLWTLGYVAFSKGFRDKSDAGLSRVFLGIGPHGDGLWFGVGRHAADLSFDRAVPGATAQCLDGHLLIQVRILELHTVPDPDPDWKTRRGRTLSSCWLDVKVFASSHGAHPKKPAGKVHKTGH